MKKQFCLYRISLNSFTDMHTITWKDKVENDFYTYLYDGYLEYLGCESTDVTDIIVEQNLRAFNYKPYNDIEILNNVKIREKSDFVASCREEKELFMLFSKYVDKFGALGKFRCIKEYVAAGGRSVIQKCIDSCKTYLMSQDDIINLAMIIIEWYNRYPQYTLCGYSPIEMHQIYSNTSLNKNRKKYR